MVNLNEFEANFKNFEIPEELVELVNFQNSIGDDENFSDQFYIGRDYSDKSGISGYSDHEEFTDSIIEFAMADGSGSSYAFWVRNNNKNLSEAPILAFGSEGGIHIVAKNIRELLQILTFDVEPAIGWDDIYYYKDEDDYEPTEKTEEYRKWVLEKYGIETTEDPDEIVKNAQEMYENEFQNWLKKYYHD
ncbi:hypothetical protein MKJ01_17410 [Chryseobacterium sp. SSA4.19]|uniref:hypothetical protein n=1 Tax=Chryseobacterium sp. SSA4.19 TaxID=2919915 RepID=UPI001F4EC4D8|nr:hypothetical protein [Chryseobacterium sp. SSA4.19]MCJ8155540.1 hypothetical protein [Chryseobacterium sp. SSA4.19]